MSPSTQDGLWLAGIVGCVVGGVLLTIALDDAWWLAVATVTGFLALASGPADRGGR